MVSAFGASYGDEGKFGEFSLAGECGLACLNLFIRALVRILADAFGFVAIFSFIGVPPGDRWTPVFLNRITELLVS